MVSQLSHVGQCLHLDGVGIHQRHLDCPPKTPDGHLIVIAHHIVNTRDFLRWALGSILAEMVRRRPRKSGGKSFEWAKQFADAARIDKKERLELIAMCTFYPPGKRTIELSYNHYREAMYGASNGQPNAITRALAYLQLAHDNEWNVPQLRRHIRSSGRTHKPTMVRSDLAHYSPVFSFRRFAASELKQINAMSPDRAKMMLADLGADSQQLIDRLKQVAAS